MEANEKEIILMRTIDFYPLSAISNERSKGRQIKDVMNTSGRAAEFCSDVNTDRKLSKLPCLKLTKIGTNTIIADRLEGRVCLS